MNKLFSTKEKKIGNSMIIINDFAHENDDKFRLIIDLSH